MLGYTSVGKPMGKDRIKIDPEKIIRHVAAFPSLVDIVLTSFENRVDITLRIPGTRDGTIRAYRPALSPHIDHEKPEDRERHKKEYQRQLEEAKETARREYEEILRKVEEGRYILHLYDDGRVDLKLT